MLDLGFAARPRRRRGSRGTNGARLAAAAGTDSDGTWIAPTLAAGWSTVTFFAPAGYTRVGDLVLIRGAIKGGNAGDTLFTVPDGYKPSQKMIFATIASGPVVARIDVDTAGNVIYASGSTAAAATYLSINNIVFLAEA